MILPAFFFQEKDRIEKEKRFVPLWYELRKGIFKYKPIDFISKPVKRIVVIEYIH